MYYEAPEVTNSEKDFSVLQFRNSQENIRGNGGFDERYYPSFEDIEYFSRLDRLGRECRMR